MLDLALGYLQSMICHKTKPNQFFFPQIRSVTIKVWTGACCAFAVKTFIFFNS